MISKKAYFYADSYGIILPSDNKQTIEKKEKKGKKIRTNRTGFIRWRDWLNPPADWLNPLAGLA